MKYRPVFAAAVLALLPAPALAGGVVCSVVDGIWQSGHASAQSNLTGSVNAMATAVSTQSQITAEQLISAIKVATRQKSASSGRGAAYGKSTAQAVAQVYASQTAAERIREAHETYGPQGQAVGSCDFIEKLQGADVAINSIPEKASEIARDGSIYSAPGSTMQPGEAVAIALRYDVPEAVSAEAFTSHETSDALKTAFMNNVIGFPPVKPSGLGSTTDRLAMMQARRAEAVRSPAIVSLAAIRAAQESSGHYGSSSGGLSADEYLDWLISRYGGGSEYEQWSAALVTKSEVGLLKEQVRLRGINLMLENASSSSDDRRQAMIAAMLASEAVK